MLLGARLAFGNPWVGQWLGLELSLPSSLLREELHTCRLHMWPKTSVDPGMVGTQRH